VLLLFENFPPVNTEDSYRLRCIEVIWLDIRAANSKGAEDTLWAAHRMVIGAYRRALGKLTSHEQVLKRKLERAFASSLKTAQFFYKGYLQRIDARYEVKDLRRIVRKAGVEEMAPEASKIDPAAAQIEDIVRSSCHNTLTYLGDLARYRAQLHPKFPKFDNALAYYGLAIDLIPESGFAHHQCAAIFTELKDYLQVLYHLYRSLACEKPHPNAKKNLEVVFNTIRGLEATDAKNALVHWFLKLHASYYEGKEFTRRKALEQEVDNRMSMALKAGTGLDSDDTLLKMVLINICSCVTAHNSNLGKTVLSACLRDVIPNHILANWSEEGSRTYGFILLLNVRMIQAIAHVLGLEITDLLERNRETPPTKDGTTDTQRPETLFTAAFKRVLLLLRVYMAWLCSYGAELVEFQAYLAPHFGTMCTTLSNTLTLLFELLASNLELGKPVSWRFPEDEMTMSIKCLNGPHLRDGCQLYYDAFTRQPKPRREDVPSDNATDDDVIFTRILDVVCCTLALSDTGSRFPFNTSTMIKDSRQHTTVVYLAEGKPVPAATAQAQNALPATAAAGPVPIPAATVPAAVPVSLVPTSLTASAPPVQHPIPSNVATPAATQPVAPNTARLTPARLAVPPSPARSSKSNELSEDAEFYGPNLRTSSTPVGNPAAAVAAQYAQLSQAVASAKTPKPAPVVSEYPIENQLFQILNDFLAPPETARKSQPQTPSHVSAQTNPYTYASVTTAEEPPKSPPPGTSGAKPFPTLPWNFIINPEPVGSVMPGFSRPASSAHSLSHATHVRNGSRGSPGDLSSSSPQFGTAVPSNGRSSQSLQTYANIYGSRSTWISYQPNQHQLLASNDLAAIPSAAPRQNPWDAAVISFRTDTSQQGGTHYAVASSSDRAVPPSSSFSNLDLSSSSSSLPPVNSSWGLPTAQQQQRNASQGMTGAESLATQYALRSRPSEEQYRWEHSLGIGADGTSTPAGRAWAHARTTSSENPLFRGTTGGS